MFAGRFFLGFVFMIGFFISLVLGILIGVGATQWEQVEYISLFFYSGSLIIILFGLAVVAIGLAVLGFEFWRFVRKYRQTVDKRFEHANNISIRKVSTPQLPKPQLIDVNLEILETAETLFYPAES